MERKPQGSGYGKVGCTKGQLSFEMNTDKALLLYSNIVWQSKMTAIMLAMYLMDSKYNHVKYRQMEDDKCTE